MTGPPDIPVLPQRRSLAERFSVVWLIPIAALLIALGIAWQSYSERGPLIVIAFDSASGIRARETVLRFRDVDLGLVEAVAFSPSLRQVEVSVRLKKDIAPYVDEDAQFWVVRPQVTAQGVSGLDTVLSGVFIEGMWDTVPGGLVEYHRGLADAPLMGVGETGLRIVLRAAGGAQLNEASPILFKGIPVGRLGKPRLSGDGSEAVADAIILSPHDALVSSETRFWDTSGFSFRIGASGAELDFSSLASLISGSVSFDTIVSGGDPVPDGTGFDVYAEEATARGSVFSGSRGPSLALAVVFDENVSGLTAGSPVEIGGVRIGEVTGLRGLVDRDRFGDARVRLQATLEIRPERLGLEPGTTSDQAIAFLGERVADGLRARLATAGILTGGLKVELLRVADAPPAVIEFPDDSLPVLPGTDNDIRDVAATAQGVLQRVNDLPVEELLESAIAFLDNASTLVGSDEVNRVPGEMIGLLAEARGVIGSDEVQKLPGDLAALLDSLQGTSDELRALLAEVERAETIARVLGAVDAVGAAASETETALSGLPGLLAQMDALAAKANALPVERLLAETTGLAESARSLLASDSAKALPATMNGALDEVRQVAAEVSAGNGVERILAAVDALGAAAGDVNTAVEGVPSLVARIDALTAKAQALPVEDLLTQATELAGSAQALLDNAETQALPGSLNAAIADLRGVIDEIDARDGVARLLAAIDAAGLAAGQAGESFAGMPDLIARLNALAQKTSDLPLDQLVVELTGIVESADAMLSSEGARDLPENLSGALAQLQAVLAELREGGTVTNANRTLASTAQAAEAIAAAAEDLPDLVNRINALASQARTTLAAFDGNSQLSRDAGNALREIQKAAQAVSSLSRALERRPNSIILGR